MANVRSDCGTKACKRHCLGGGLRLDGSGDPCCGPAGKKSRNGVALAQEWPDAIALGSGLGGRRCRYFTKVPRGLSYSERLQFRERAADLVASEAAKRKSSKIV